MKNLIKRISSVVVAGALVLGSVAILPGTKKKVVYAAEPKYDSANLVNYATIMGRAVDYGIVSQSITQSMHMETTFATYSYSRTVDTTTDVDLTNAKTAQFIIGEVTSRGDLGTLKFGKVRTSSDQVFVENMSITLSEGMDPNRYIRYQDDVAQTTKFNYSYRTKKEIQESIDTVIDHARDESGEMVTRTGDADYVLDSKNNSLVSVNGSITTINIDDPKYDNKVVYVNLDDAKFKNLLSAWATEPNGHHLDINKRSSTVVVFTSAKKEAITLGKVSVYAKDSPLYASAASTGVHDYDSYASVTTYSGNQSSHNAYVDKEIAQKLIWNITGSNDITISSNAGTFLCLAGDKTNRNVKVKLKGNPCAGWLVVNGNVKNECEYHYIYGGHSQSQGTEGEGQMHFVARKGFTTKYETKDNITPYVDNSVAFKEGDYQFFWQEYTDDTFRTPVGQKSTVKVKDTSYMEFPTVTFVKNNPSDPHNVTAAGKNFYFRITEDPSKSLSGIKNSAGHIDVCLNAYVSNTGVIKFKMQSVTMIGADDTHLIQYDKNGTWGSSTDWVDVVNTRFDLGAFFNKIQVPGYMTITKTIEGDVTEEDLNGLTFTVTDGGAFTKVYKLGKDFTKNPTTGIYELTTPITVPDAETQYTVTETLYSLDGYKLEEVSYKVDGGAKKDSDEATLDSVSTDSNAPTTVAYTDSYTPLGTLTVKKTAKAENNKNINYYYKFSVKNSAGQYLQADKKTFGAKEVFFTIGTDETVEFKDIPVDEYTITEKTNDLFVYGYTFEAASSITSGKADVTKKANTDFTLDNRFTMDRGSLTVKKTATDNNGNSVEGTFKFTISTPMRGYLQADGSFGNTIHYFTISDGESMTFDNLPVDNYNVTEDLSSVSVTGYTFNSTDSKYSVLGRVTKNGNTNAELVNKYTQDVGELRVTKTAQDNHNTNVSGSFEFSVKNSKGQYLQADKKTFDTTEVFFTVEAGSYTSFENLPVGKYTVTEKTDSISVTGYTFTSTGSTTSDSATVAKDTTVEVKLINNFIQDLGSLTVSKIAKDNNNNDVSGSFRFSVKNSAGKYLQGNETDFADAEFFFTVEAGSSKTFTDLPVGEYTITEKTDDISVSGYTFTLTGSTTSGTGIVSKTTTADSTVTLTNKFIQDVGKLTVKKTATDNYNKDVTGSFKFSVMNSKGKYLQADEKTFGDTEYFFTVDAGSSKLFTDLPVGEYTVKEDTDSVSVEGYTFRKNDSSTSVNADVAKNSNADAELINKFTLILGSLTITKALGANAPASASSKEYTFTVTGPNKFSQTVKIKGAASETLTGLVPGTYHVSEDPQSAIIRGYDVVIRGGGDVDVTANATAEKTITNTYIQQKGSLKITKALGSNAPRAAASKTYTFTVTGPNGYSATVQITGARSETLTDLIPGTYTVTEDENGAAISGYDLSVTGGGSVEVLPNDVATITVTNDYTEILGSLTVKKEVTGAPASEADKLFQFAVRGPNRYITFVNLKAGEEQTLFNLPLGTYTVTEVSTDAWGQAQIKGYTLAVSGEGAVELTTADLDAEVTITNAYTEILGSLTVKKEVNGAPASAADKEFEFTVTGPNGYSETFTLKNGETKTLTDLHLGTYTVTETGDASIENYQLVTTGSGADVTLTSSNKDQSWEVTNDYTEILGSLTVKKEVTGAPASEANKTFEFTVTGPNSYSETFTLKSGETKTLTDLKLGTYTVTENDTAAQISGYDLVVTGEGDVTLTAADKDKTATVTNEYSDVKGSLTVKKTVTGAPASEANKTFEFTVTGPNNYSETFTLKNGESKTLSNLALGKYTVTENGTAANGTAQITGYDLVVTGEGDVTLTAADKDKTATVTNAYAEILGSLTVKKTVTGAPASEANKTFEFTVTGPNGYSETFTLKNGESKTLSDLALGTYTVTENGTAANGAAQISGYDLVVSGEGDVELTAADKDKTAIVTNAYTEILGSLTVTKTVTGAPASEANKTFEFTVTGPNNYSETFTLKNGESKTLSDLKLGTYTVTENGTAANGAAQITGYDLVVTGEGDVELTVSDKDKTATVTNAYTEILGSLTVTKTVTGAPASEANKTFEFTVTGPNNYSATFTLKAGETKTLTDLKLGTYTVTENGTAANGTAQITGYDLVVTGEGDVTLTAADKDKTATVTNAYAEILGSLTVTKTVTGAPASEANKTFEFTVTGPNNYSETFTLKNGESKTLTDLKLGTYTVTENGTAANGAAQISGYDLVVSGEGDVELTAADKDKTATVTNAYSDVKGSLTVKKTVTGAPASEANKTFEFTVTGPNNYSETFTLKNGESKTLSNLALGKYTVTENGTAANGTAQITGYDLVVTGEGDVTLTAADKDKTATVTNAYAEILGSLTVTKTVTGAPASEANKTFEFTVTGPNNYSETFTLKAGETKTLTDLKLGTYTVAETGTAANGAAQISGYDLVVTGEGDVTLTAADKDKTETVTNAYTEILGSLTITKTVTGAPASEANKTFEFTVTGPNNYSETFTLKAGERKVLSDLVLGTYTVTENGTTAQISGYDLVVSGEGDVTLTASAKDGSATVTNTYTQKKGSLIVSKTAKDDSNKDVTGTFEFSVKNSEGKFLQADEKTFDTAEVFFTVAAGSSKAFADLPVGGYVVTEKTTNIAISGYTFDQVNSTTSDTATITNNGTAEVELINKYILDLGSLTITKALGTNAPAAAALKTYTFTVSGPNGYSAIVQIDGAGSETLTDLVPGRYTVTENETAAAISGYDLVVSGGGAVAVVANTVATTTITNTYTEVKGSLTVTKTVTGAPASEANKTFEFTVTGPNNYSTTVTLKAGESQTLTDLALGTYTITENGTAAGGAAQISGYTLAVSGEGDVVLTATDKAKTATVTNAYTEEVKGSLTVTKTVTGAPTSEANKTFEFTVTGPNNYSTTVTLKAGESQTLTDLALGTYTVTESGTAANGAAQISGYTLAVSGEGDVELTATDKAKTATVTNAYTEEVKGSLTVTKTVTGAPASAFDKEFEFTVTGPNNYSETFKLKNGERKVLSDLALGTYTVTENGTASDGAAQIKGYTLAVSGEGDVTLTASDKDKTSAVTNAYTETNEKTSVSIQKVWDDNNNQNGDRPASLTVTLSNGQSVVLDDSNAWSATVNDLPKYENGSEIVYSWSEEQVQGYRMSSNVKDQNDPSKTIITNTYDASSVQTSATVKKVWDDNNDAAGLRPSSLVVYLLQNGTQINTCTLNEQNGWTATVNNLAKYDASNVEYVYTWTEEQITVAGYALESATVSDTTTTLTNKYTAPAPVLGSLKIKKALAAGAPTDASSMTYHFTVTGTKGYTTTVDIQGEGEFVLDNLELDTYTVTEDTAAAAIGGYTLSVTNNGATVVINSANQEECVITNTYKKDVQTTPDPTGTNPTGTEPTGTEPTGTKPSGTKPSQESPYSEVQEPSETTPTPTTAPDKKIDSVSIDDKPVSPEDYTDKPDGTVEFSSNTIEGLTLGVHRALIKYNDGTTITIEFEVVSSAGRGRSIVKTGDTAKSNLVPAAAFLFIAVAAVAIVIFRRRRTERDAD